MLTPTEKIWHNGRFIAWDDAKIHVLSHVVSYGSSVFEGIRCYATPSGPAIFRLAASTFAACSIRPRSTAWRISASRRPQLEEGMRELVRVNKLRSCYIRPIVLRAYGEMGVNPLKNPLDVFIACWEWGKYLGEEALAEGVDVCVSSWNRIAPNTLPALAKAGANYMNSQLIKMEAITNGYSEGIALDAAGYVSEGSGENIFLVRDGKITHAAARRFRAAGDHARLGIAAGAGSGDSRGRDHRPARDAVYRRRSLLLRNGGRNHADPLHRSHRHRQGAARTGGGAIAKRIFRDCEWNQTRPARMAFASGSSRSLSFAGKK